LVLGSSPRRPTIPGLFAAALFRPPATAYNVGCPLRVPLPGEARLNVPRLPLLVLLVAVSWLTAGHALADNRGKVIMGFVERIEISDTGFSVKARMDTGALTSSLDSHNIRRFRRGDQRYVRFDVIDPDSGKLITLERRLLRNVRIRQHEGEPMRRPVVEMTVCIGDMLRTIEVNLTSRSGFLYPMLIGRSAMAGAIVIDPELTFTQRPSCDPSGYPE